MCGINVIIDKNQNLGDNYVIQKMNNALRHRGPDNDIAYDISIDNYTIYLGYTQLKIQDKNAEITRCTATSDQRHYLSFNGEIYNHNSLRQKDIEYNTKADSESLLYFLRKHKGQKIDQLDGMFSFIFVDKATKKTTIARDRHGIKPLFYYEDENYLIASSEIKGILSTGLVKKELNEKQISHYLSYKYTATPQTFYKNIYSLEPQQQLQYRDGKSSINEWEIDTNETSQLNSEESLVKSVWQCISGEAPIGLMLSGGVDSTLLLALSQEIKPDALPCYTITTDKDVFYGTSDTKFAELAAAKYGGDLHSIHLDRSSLDHIHTFVNTLDQPIGDGAQFLTWLLASKAKEKVKILLNGAGADELYAGYNRHLAFQKYIAHIHNKPFKKSFLTSSKFLFRSNNKRKFIDSFDKNPAHTFRKMTATKFAVSEQSNLNEWHGDLTNQALEYDRKNFLVNDVLALSDHATMQHSIECRVPYLDNNLVNLANNISGERKLEEGKKWILKHYLNSRQGQKFTNRKKEGFGVPIGAWILERPIFFEDLENEQNPIFEYCDYRFVKQLIEEHKTTRIDNKTELWSLKILSEWLAQF